MDLTPYVAALRDDLASAAAVGDEATTRAGAALAAALEPAVRLAMMNALADLAAEVSDALDDHTVDLRLSGRDVRVVVDREPAVPATPESTEESGEEAPGGFFAGPSSSPFVGAGPFGRPGGGDPFSPGFGRGGPDVGDISRMTLRLVDQIKGQAERAAAAQGLSLNSWVAQAVQGALRDAGRAGGWPGHHRSDGPDGPGPDDQRRPGEGPDGPSGAA